LAIAPLAIHTLCSNTFLFHWQSCNLKPVREEQDCCHTLSIYLLVL